MVRNSRLFLIVLLLLLVLAAAGCARGAKTPDKGAGVPPVPVAAEAAGRGDVLKVLTASGQLLGEQSVVVSPKVSGRVASVQAAVGSAVRAGEVLFTLDDSEIRAQVAQAEAAVAVAREKLKVAQQNRENAARQYERNKVLYEAGAISAEVFESIAFKLEQARSGEPEAALAQAEAALAYQRSQLANTVVTAPITGTVAQRGVEPGSMVSAATQAFTVVNLDRAKVQVSVGEQHVGKISSGQEVKVMVPAVGPDPFAGTIAGVSPAADPKTKSFLVEVTMDNSGGVLKQGMFAEVRLIVGRSENALIVPVDAVVARNNENIVFTVVEGKARENKVQVGLTDGRVTEITGGLVQGDQVVIVGQQGLVDGARVVVQGAQSPQGLQGSQGPADVPGGPPKGEKQLENS